MRLRYLAPLFLFFVHGYVFAKTGIATCTDLQNMWQNLNGEYVLSNDIDCSGVAFRSVGNIETPFTGVLEGDGYQIKNLKVDGKNWDYAGLFGVTKDATISGLKLVNVQVVGKNYAGALMGAGYHTHISDVSSSGTVGVIQLQNDSSKLPKGVMGGLSGYLLDQSTLNRVSSDATVELQGTIRQSDVVGGLVGTMENSSITESHSSGNIRGNDAGGLVGVMRSGSIISSYATGSVDASALTSGGSAGRMGGLIGAVSNAPYLISHSYSTSNVGTKYSSPFVYDMGGLIGSAYSTTCPQNVDCLPRIENNFATGEVRARIANTGGLIGSMGLYTSTSPKYTLHFENNYSTGKVTSSPNSAGYTVGGLVGKSVSASTFFKNNYWDIETSGDTYSPVGEGKKTAQMYQRSTYVNWNFDSIWGIDEGQGYPFLMGL